MPPARQSGEFPAFRPTLIKARLNGWMSFRTWTGAFPHLRYEASATFRLPSSHRATLSGIGIVVKRPTEVQRGMRGQAFARVAHLPAAALQPEYCTYV